MHQICDKNNFFCRKIIRSYIFSQIICLKINFKQCTANVYNTIICNENYFSYILLMNGKLTESRYYAKNRGSQPKNAQMKATKVNEVFYSYFVF